MVRSWVFLKKRLKEVFGAFSAHSSVSLGPLHPVSLLKLRSYKITIAQRETNPYSGARIRDCSWCCQSSAMELLTQKLCFFFSKRRCIEMDMSTFIAVSTPVREIDSSCTNILLMTCSFEYFWWESYCPVSSAFLRYKPMRRLGLGCVDRWRVCRWFAEGKGNWRNLFYELF